MDSNVDGTDSDSMVEYWLLDGIKCVASGFEYDTASIIETSDGIEYVERMGSIIIYISMELTQIK